MKSYFKIVLSLLILILGLYAVLYWINEFITILKGTVGVIIVLIGLAALLITMSELR